MTGTAAQQLKAAAHTSTEAWVQNVGFGDAEARGHSFPAPQHCRPGRVGFPVALLTSHSTCLLQRALPGAQLPRAGCTPSTARLVLWHAAVAPGLCTISAVLLVQREDNSTSICASGLFFTTWVSLMFNFESVWW